MMYSEFFERTQTKVSADEYSLIEESYYDFSGNKDEFCRAWMKDLKSGAWEKERTLRLEIRNLKEENEKQKKAYQEVTEWYSKMYDKLNTENNALKETMKETKNKLRYICSTL